MHRQLRATFQPPPKSTGMVAVTPDPQNKPTTSTTGVGMLVPQAKTHAPPRTRKAPSGLRIVAPNTTSAPAAWSPGSLASLGKTIERFEARKMSRARPVLPIDSPRAAPHASSAAPIAPAASASGSPRPQPKKRVRFQLSESVQRSPMATAVDMHARRSARPRSPPPVQAAAAD